MEIWIADTKLLELDRQLEGMLAQLPVAERERALRFRKREDRLRCATGRLLIRALAAERLGRADIPLRFHLVRTSRRYQPIFLHTDRSLFYFDKASDSIRFVQYNIR